MLLSEFQKINQQRALRWHNGDLHQWSVSDWAVAMAGEAGEVCNAVKKLRRVECGIVQAAGPADRSQAVSEISEEIADTFIYLVLLANVLNIDLESAVREKFNAVSIREGFPERV